MNLKTEAIAFAIRILAEKTTLIRKPNDFEALLNSMFGIESYDRQIARELEAEAQRAIEATKRFNTNRKFKKITKNI